MNRRNSDTWGRLWENVEEPTVTIRLPRPLADALLSALSIACEGGDMDGMGMDGDIELDFSPDFGGDDGGDDLDSDAMDLVMRADDDEDSDGDDDDSDDDEDSEDDDDDDDEDEPDDKDEGRDCADTDGMRPKTAFGEGRRRQAKRARR